MSNKLAKSDLMCLQCGNFVPTWNYMGTQRKMFQRKSLYCPNCKKTTVHIELQNIDIYIASLEFKDPEMLTEEEKKIYKLIKKG